MRSWRYPRRGDVAIEVAQEFHAGVASEGLEDVGGVGCGFEPVVVATVGAVHGVHEVAPGVVAGVGRVGEAVSALGGGGVIALEVERVARGGLTADDSGVIVTLTEHGEDGIGLGASKVRQRNGLAGVDDPVAV